MDAYVLSLITLVGINVILALGLNIITGFCGQISLGHAAFFGTGAYAAALVAKSGAGFFLALLAGAVAAALLGAIVGLVALRVREDFLAIATMGVGFLFLGIVRQQEALGGELGISQIPAHGLGASGFLAVVIGSALLLFVFSLYMQRSWLGFAFDSVADDEDTARLVGLNVDRFKLTAFIFGTLAAGFAGGLYAYYTRFIVPDAFGFILSVTILAMVVVGGIGSTLGVLIAAVLLTLMPELFRFINDIKLLLYGGLLLVVMRFSLDGLAGIARRLAIRGNAAGAPQA